MNIHRIVSPETFAPYRAALMAAKVIALDLETTGLDPHTDSIRLVQLAVPDEPVLVIDCFSFLPDGLWLLQEALSSPAVKVLQNAKFDLQFLLPLGISPSPLFDTMLAGRLLYMPGMPRRVNLQTLAEYYLDETVDKAEQTSDWSGSLTLSQLEYAARDAEVLLRLRQAMLPLLMEGGLARVSKAEFSCVRAMAAMEYHGIFLDEPQWQSLLERITAEREQSLRALYAFTGKPMAQTTLWGADEIIGFNFDSTGFVRRLLADHGVVVSSTSQGDLYPYRDHPLVRALTAYRKASKALSSILQPIASMVHPKTCRLHPQYGQISAYSGRMSCANPNIQQIPRDSAYRRCFMAPPGRLLVIADYSQIELRIAARMSGDARMLEACRAGEDLHRLTASLVSGKPMAQVTRQERQAAKAVNFGLIYGMGAAGLQQYAQQAYGVDMTLAQATLFRRRFFEAYHGIERWHARLKEQPGTEGRTLAGRRFALSQTPSLPELSNTPVQGTGADILKGALGMLHDRLAGLPAWPVAVVHDEILLECDEAFADEAAVLLRETMEAAGAALLGDVPCEAEAIIASNWAAK